ncbi:MAG: hypothetical protein K1Y36_08680 [Blastocatellia bacterium]|nr:hypothetical protein [Blastocatellia bacterium]
MHRKYLESDLREVFVIPLYMKIMGGRSIPPLDYERSEQLDVVTRVVASVNPHVIDQLLEGGWREVITASWFIGLLKLESYQDEIGCRLKPRNLTKSSIAARP